MTLTIRQTQVAGIDFTVVNELPQTIIEKLEQAVTEYERHNHWEGVKSVLKFLGGGYCGRIFELSEDYIVKFETGNLEACTDGEALHDLQGVPFIPKVYYYNSEEQITVIQRIKGVNIYEYRNNDSFTVLDFDSDAHKVILDSWAREVTERGWVASDLHSQNCMVDQEGNFWVVDVGCFRKVVSDYDVINKRGAIGATERECDQLRVHMKEIARQVQHQKDKATGGAGKRLVIRNFESVFSDALEVVNPSSSTLGDLLTYPTNDTFDSSCGCTHCQRMAQLNFNRTGTPVSLLSDTDLLSTGELAEIIEKATL